MLQASSTMVVVMVLFFFSFALELYENIGSLMELEKVDGVVFGYDDGVV